MGYINKEDRQDLTIEKVATKLLPFFVDLYTDIHKEKPDDTVKRWLKNRLTEPRYLWKEYRYLLNREYENGVYRATGRDDPANEHHMAFKTITGYVYIARLSLLYPDLPAYIRASISSTKPRKNKKKKVEKYTHMPKLYYSIQNKAADHFFLDHLSTVITVLNRQGEKRLTNWYKRNGHTIKSEGDMYEEVARIAYKKVDTFINKRYRNYPDNYEANINDAQTAYTDTIHCLSYIDEATIPTKGEVTQVRVAAQRLHRLANKLDKEAQEMEARRKKQNQDETAGDST